MKKNIFMAYGSCLMKWCGIIMAMSFFMTSCDSESSKDIDGRRPKIYALLGNLVEGNSMYENTLGIARVDGSAQELVIGFSQPETRKVFITDSRAFRYLTFAYYKDYEDYANPSCRYNTTEEGSYVFGNEVFNVIEDCYDNPDAFMSDYPTLKIYPCNIDGFSYKWIELERVEIDGEWRLQIRLDENTTGKTRMFIVRTVAAADPANPSNDHFLYGFYESSFHIVQEPLENQEPENVPVKIRYKNTVYAANAMENESGEVVYDNEEFTAIMAQLAATPGIECVVMDNDIIDYFDAEDMGSDPRLAPIRNKVPEAMQIKPLSLTRANGFEEMEAGAVSFLGMYDDTGFTDTHFTQSFYSHYNVFTFNDLHDIGLNDKISSVAIAYAGDKDDVCAVLTLWDDIHYNNADDSRSKHRITFVTTPENRTLSRSSLKNVPCLGSSRSWNDRASSMSFHLGQYGKTFPDY